MTIREIRLRATRGKHHNNDSRAGQRSKVHRDADAEQLYKITIRRRTGRQGQEREEASITTTRKHHKKRVHRKVDAIEIWPGGLVLPVVWSVAHRNRLEKDWEEMPIFWQKLT